MLCHKIQQFIFVKTLFFTAGCQQAGKKKFGVLMAFPHFNRCDTHTGRAQMLYRFIDWSRHTLTDIRTANSNKKFNKKMKRSCRKSWNI